MYIPTMIEVLTVYSAVVTIASIIVKITPSTKDDEMLGKIKNFMSKYVALNEKYPKIKI